MLLTLVDSELLQHCVLVVLKICLFLHMLEKKSALRFNAFQIQQINFVAY
jgi:hypothetical protein